MVENLISPKADHPFIWYAKFDDHTVYEFDNDLKETKFDDLDTKGVSEFGFLGMHGRFCFNGKTGTFILDDDRPIDVYLGNENGNIHITKVHDMVYDNVIQRKQINIDFSPSNPNQQTSPMLAAYEFGHRGSIKTNNMVINYQLIYHIAMQERDYNQLIIALVSNADWKGDIHVKYLNNEFIKENVTLEANKQVIHSVGL